MTRKIELSPLLSMTGAGGIGRWMSATDRTVAWIEDEPTGMDGFRQEDTVLIHFTDGSALEVSGSYSQMLAGTEVRDRQRKAAGRREKQRLNRLRREAWMALSCEERGERKRAREQAAGPFVRAMMQIESQMIADFVRDVNRSSFMLASAPESYRGACLNCGERDCPNAPLIAIS